MQLIEALHEVIQVVDPEVAYEQALALAQAEDVSEWGALIQEWLSQRNQAVPLLRLQRAGSLCQRQRSRCHWCKCG